MRIAFVTSSLEPGKDGVGDYTRDLAAACESARHSCSLLALNDRHINTAREEQQFCRGARLETLRLPASGPWLQRLEAAKSWLDRFDADQLSLQFVVYGFNPKGLIGNLGSRLAPLFQNKPLELMLHELWIGMERTAPWKRRLIGAMQRRAVLNLIRQLQPSVIHTSNTTYAALLRTHGVNSRVLPLCGSIPLVANPDMEWLGRELVQLRVPHARAMSRESAWRFGIFGSLLSAWEPEPLFSYISEAAAQARREVIIAAIGRSGPGASIWEPLQSRYGRSFSFAALGERSAREVSLFFQSIDFGIAMSPWQLIGKSAASAAMIDHGVPVIVSRDEADYGLDGFASNSPLLYRMDPNAPQWLLNVQRQTPRSRLTEMAQQFLADIESTAPARGCQVSSTSSGRLAG